MKLKSKISSNLNEKFRELLPQAFYKKFKIKIKTQYDFFEGALTTHRLKGQKFTKEQEQFVSTYQQAYLDAWDVMSATG